MRIPLIALVALGAAPAARQAPPASPAAPCTTATTACEQWVIYGAGPARSMVYATYALRTPNAAITRALIMVHGAARNADHYFRTATAAAFLDGALGNTIVVAPHFIAERDTAQPNEVRWPERGDTWRSGGMSPSNPTLSSFDFMDEILRTLADKNVFPNLATIVVAGHSAGGQFATRYEMANKVDGTLGVRIRYVVANPSSYAWPAAVRPLPTGDASPDAALGEPLGKLGETVHTTYAYGPFDSTRVPRYNHWPAGLEDRHGYTAQMSDEQLRKQLAERTTTYLLGQVDVLPLGGFDSSPSAMAQGPTRRARGEAFFKYVTETLGAKTATAIIVPECGHNDRCIYTTREVFPVIFPK
ncbi:MAG TPA: alpha/beta fold hydrolase [Gemmatimonadaceae bacterium]|nr:alpha/beta fold hydrolase [Gemmatimonadaceae bacterium]